jgi:outer membrane protein TolC
MKPAQAFRPGRAGRAIPPRRKPGHRPWGSTAALLAAASVWIVLGGAAASAASEGPETLGFVRGDTLYVTAAEVIQMALMRNEMIAAASEMASAAGAEALGAWRGFLPQLQLGAFRIRSDDPLNSFAFKLNQRRVEAADFNPDLLNDPDVAENNVMQLSLKQPIFNGGMSIAGKRAADKISRAAGHDHARAAETVEFQAVQAYHGLALAKALEKVMVGATEAGRGHLRQAQAMFNAEMATEADLLQARVYLSGLEQQLIEVRNLVAVAGETIKLLTALETELPLAPAEELAMPAAELLPPAAPTGRVRERSDIKAYEQRAEAAGSMVGVARGAMLPHINLSAERDYYSESQLFGDDARSWTVGIYGTWNVFAGLGNLGQLKRARAEHRAAEYLYDFRIRQAKLEATEAWLAARAAAAKVRVAREAVQAARESLRIVTNQYGEGLVSMVDLLDTQAAATQAEGNLVHALHDYSIGLARLRYASAPAETTAGGLEP